MNVPSSEVDLFSDEVLAEPYEHCRALRDLGPVVWMERLDAFALPRYAEVRQALGDHETFCSGNGVGFNPFINEGGQGTTLMSDGEAHRRQREVIGRPLTPKALAELRPQAQALADALVDRLVEQRSFDAVTELAEVIPATWVPDLLGWPADGRDRLLDWGAANFDGLGPMNARTEAAGERLLEMLGYAQEVAARGFPDGSMAAGILDAAQRGEVHAARVPMMVIDYLAPSLDTTVSALGNAVWLFATHPDQWALLGREPERVKSAFNEVLRFESPINCFTRVTTTVTEIGGVELPADARIVVMHASANRDERRWDRADEFDITRDSAGQLAFGYGVHACVGMGLARLEGAAVLNALAQRVERFELGDPVRRLNNLIRAFGSLPVTVHPA